MKPVLFLILLILMWAGVYSPYVKLTYTDGTTEEVTRGNYIRSI